MPDEELPPIGEEAAQPPSLPIVEEAAQPPSRSDPDLDDTVVTGNPAFPVEASAEASDSTRVVRVRAQLPQFTLARALPPQAPPVNDITLLEFRPPEVPSGGTVRYRTRVHLEVTELPDFDADAHVPPRERLAAAPERIRSQQHDRARQWHRRALTAVVLAVAVAVAIAVPGIALLTRL